MTAKPQAAAAILAVAATLALLLGGTPAAATAESLAPGIAAVVNGQTISEAEFNAYLVRTARQRFYHHVDPKRITALRSEVIESMILARLLQAEADRQGIAGNPAEVEALMKHYFARLPDDAAREKFETEQGAALRQQLLIRSKMRKLEAQVRTVPAPDEGTLRKFYESRLAAFTEPVRNRVSLILLKVDPGATEEAWKATAERAVKIREEILQGGDFVALAKKYSQDETAASGGDMGYQHRGMLARVAEDAIAKLAIGGITEPIRLLEGYGIFRLEGRIGEIVHRFEEPGVRAKVEALYRREEGERRWAEFERSLRKAATVQISATISEAATENAGSVSGAKPK